MTQRPHDTNQKIYESYPGCVRGDVWAGACAVAGCRVGHPFNFIGDTACLETNDGGAYLHTQALSRADMGQPAYEPATQPQPEA
ncbi:MAG TPA: hypothetical protein VFB59_02250 [Candidatus Saccharimonadales bacterium]|nr:hypothetical protein [Candidatus Saccharimonadales bacterium]